MPAGRVDEAVLREALEAVELPALAGRLAESGNWALQLSPGEQQRIAFARVLPRVSGLEQSIQQLLNMLPDLAARRGVATVRFSSP